MKYLIKNFNMYLYIYLIRHGFFDIYIIIYTFFLFLIPKCSKNYNIILKAGFKSTSVYTVV
jgi:hypothetical protein